jgi:hypothetical protein
MKGSHPLRILNGRKIGGDLEEPIFDTEDAALIPNGDYIAQCVDYEATKSRIWNRRILRLQFKLLDGQKYSGFILSCYVNYPEKIGRASKYFLFWCIANGGVPSRKGRMNPRVFKDHIFKIRTRMVEKNNRQQPLPAYAHYSVIDEILELQA